MEDSNPATTVSTERTLHPIVIFKLLAMRELHLYISGRARNTTGNSVRLLILHLIVQWFSIHLTEVNTLLIRNVKWDILESDPCHVIHLFSDNELINLEQLGGIYQIWDWSNTFL